MGQDQTIPNPLKVAGQFVPAIGYLNKLLLQGRGSAYATGNLILDAVTTANVMEIMQSASVEPVALLV